MEEMNTEKSEIVRQYQCREALNWNEQTDEYLRLKTEMWNSLVLHEQHHNEQYQQIVSSDAAVAEIMTQISDHTEKCKSLVGKRTVVRKKLRKRKCPETKPFDKQISSLRAKIKKLKREETEVRKKARENAEPLLAMLEEKRKEAYKTIYQKNGVYLDSFDDFIEAMSAAQKRKGNLRLRRHNSTGTFRINLTEGCTVDDLTEGQHPYISLDYVSPEEFSEMTGTPPFDIDQENECAKNRRYALLKFSVDEAISADGKLPQHQLHLPLVLNQPLPESSENRLLTGASIKRDKLGPGQYGWTVNLTFSEPVDPEQAQPLMAVI